MLFIVPDSGDAPAGAQASGKASDSKARTSGINVELDLEDAPFLDEPPPEQEKKPEEKPAEPPVPAVPEQEAKPTFKAKLRALLQRLAANKKRLILAGGSLVLIIAIAVAVNIFLFSSPAPEPEKTPPPPQETSVEPQRVPYPSTPTLPESPPPPKFNVELQPFWIPFKGTEGETRFLVCEFSIATDDPVVQAEVNARQITLRDAVYYFLKNEKIVTLLEKDHMEVLKSDIISVINEHLTAGKVETIFLNNFYATVDE